MDLISRKAAIDALCKRCDLVADEDEPCTEKCNDIKILEMLPSAGLKKGKWIPHSEKSREYIGTALVNVEYDYWFCDTCGYRVENGQPIHNFCPHCGADMRSGKEERWTKNSLKKDEKY